MRLCDCADSALLVELDGGADPVAAAAALRAAALPGKGACIPGLDSVLVEYDCLAVDRAALADALRAALAGAAAKPPQPPRSLSLEVCFDPTVAPDLAAVGAATGLSAAEVVVLLTTTELRVAMVGHLPGLPYLTGLPPVLRLPRLPSPRVRVPAGSLGLAGGMACVYPWEAPGGWHLVGRSPVRLWDGGADPPALLRPGDLVRLEAVSAIALDDRGRAGAGPGELW